MPTTHAGADEAQIDVDLPLAQVARTLERTVNIDSLVHFTSPAVFRDILALQHPDDRPLISPDLSSALPRRRFGFPVFLSSQISPSEVQGGSGASCSWLSPDDMSQIVVTLRQEPPSSGTVPSRSTTT